MASKSARGAAKWLSSLTSGQAQEAYKSGIANTTVNPMQLSADAETKYLQKVQESVSSGRRRARLMAVPVSTWKDNATNKGAARLSSGAQAAAGKVQAHFQKWGPIYDSISAACASMPNNSTEDGVARVRRAIEMSKAAAGKTM